MPLSERQNKFVSEAVKDPLCSPNWKTTSTFGVSNGAKVIDKALLLGVSNLERLRDDVEGVLLACSIKFPPEDEVYFAVLIQTELVAFRQRLSNMIEASTNGDPNYYGRNNNVRFYLSNEGKLHLHNKTYFDGLNEGLIAALAPSITVDKILVAVFPPAASAQRSLLTRGFVGYLAKFVGKSKVTELKPFGDVGMVGQEMKRMPLTIATKDIISSIEVLGGHYIDKLVERFHVGLNHLPHKHFVILTGLSGTGKTGLVKRYALAVHGVTDPKGADALFVNCPVRPDWTDPTGLLGYHDIISGKYVVPPFLEAVLLAIIYPDSPVFVCLDEMNLARVEYYFADVLSAMEAQTPLQLHSNSIPIEGSTGGEIPSSLPLPSNLFIVGTINVDETTHPVSDKVLDRAIVIDMSAVDLSGFFDQLKSRDPGISEAIDACQPILTDLNETLTPSGLGFGYRVAEEFVRYYALALAQGIDTSNNILDQHFLQKVLVKLRGTQEQAGMLNQLKPLVKDFPRSFAAVERMQQDLNQMGAFQFGR